MSNKKKISNGDEGSKLFFSVSVKATDVCCRPAYLSYASRHVAALRSQWECICSNALSLYVICTTILLADLLRHRKAACDAAEISRPCFRQKLRIAGSIAFFRQEHLWQRGLGKHTFVQFLLLLHTECWIRRYYTRTDRPTLKFSPPAAVLFACFSHRLAVGSLPSAKRISALLLHHMSKFFPGGVKILLRRVGHM